MERRDELDKEKLRIKERDYRNIDESRLIGQNVLIKTVFRPDK